MYSFGVLALEVMKGQHPGGDLITLLSLSSPSTTRPAILMLEDLLDDRLPPPTDKISGQIFGILKLATACLHENPQSRPSMKDVSHILSTLINFQFVEVV